MSGREPAWINARLARLYLLLGLRGWGCVLEALSSPLAHSKEAQFPLKSQRFHMQFDSPRFELSKPKRAPRRHESLGRDSFVTETDYSRLHF